MLPNIFLKILVNWISLILLPISSHVLNYDSVTVCDGMAKQIQCPNNENIHVLQGFYGKWRGHNCKGENDPKDTLPSCSIERKKATSVAREICQGINTCKLISDKSIFGDPCDDRIPYLYVTFFCMAQGQKLNHQKTENNEEVVTVPSHGFVVEETKHIDPVALKRQSIVSHKKNILPFTNPSPDDQENINNAKVEKKKPLVHQSEPLKQEDNIKKSDSISINENKTVSNISTDVSEPRSSERSSSELKENNLKIENIINKSRETSESSNVTKVVSNENSVAANEVKAKPIVEGEEVQKSDLPTLLVDKKKDPEGIRSSTICNGQSKLIACLPEEGIKINYAFYGKKSGRDCRGPLPYKDESPSCSALDAKTNVKNSCDGKQTCLLFADDNIYGKSLCPNVNKYLYLTYYCTQAPKDIVDTPVRLTPQEDLEEDAVSRSTEPAEQVNTTVKVCNGEKRTISCNHETMKILAAFFGKEIGQDCRGDLGYRDDIPECKNPRSLDSVRFLCENRKSCELAGESAFFGEDVCPGVNKYLVVTYAC